MSDFIVNLYRAFPGIHPKHYEMDESREVFMPNGGDMRPGMVILLASESLREDPDNTAYWEVRVPYALLTKNRWATVLNVETDGINVTFDCRYEDGGTSRRSHKLGTPWYVKKYSIN